MTLAAFILAAVAIAAIGYAVLLRRRRAKHEDTARRRSSKQRRTSQIGGKPSYLRPKDDDSYENFRSRKQ